jgi:hypothetical protein
VFSEGGIKCFLPGQTDATPGGQRLVTVLLYLNAVEACRYPPTHPPQPSPLHQPRHAAPRSPHTEC